MNRLNWTLFALLGFSTCLLTACQSTDTQPGPNAPIGGQTQVIDQNQMYVLSYDLKETIGHATSTAWSCKCEVDETLNIDGVPYTIFGDCGKQNGNQLIERNGAYYLISEKLIVRRSKNER